MLDAQTFIEGKLSALSSIPEVQLNNNTVEECIYRIVTSKKFRKFALSADGEKLIKSAIAIQVEKNEPIQFGFPFGAYKLWRLDEAPEPDFAELFSLTYYARWLRGICSAYKPGVEFAFCSDEIIVERLNNVQEADTRRYEQAFRELLEFISGYIPDNFKYKLAPVRDLYTQSEFEEEFVGLQREVAHERQESSFKLSPEAKATIDLNVRLKPGQDSNPRWREENDIVHEAMMRMSRRRPQYRGENKILVFPTPIGGNCVAVGTTKNSVAKFWIGVGALKEQENTYIETILSPSQIQNTRFEWADISLKNLTQKNFSRIRII